MAFLGSDPSAAGGGYSEVSEWQRSKFQAFAVRQRRNFGHRNRTLLGPGSKVSRARGHGIPLAPRRETFPHRLIDIHEKRPSKDGRFSLFVAAMAAAV